VSSPKYFCDCRIFYQITNVMQRPIPSPDEKRVFHEGDFLTADAEAVGGKLDGSAFRDQVKHADITPRRKGDGISQDPSFSWFMSMIESTREHQFVAR
jgi:hypothetical protein